MFFWFFCFNFCSRYCFNHLAPPQCCFCSRLLTAVFTTLYKGRGMKWSLLAEARGHYLRSSNILSRIVWKNVVFSSVVQIFCPRLSESKIWQELSKKIQINHSQIPYPNGILHVEYNCHIWQLNTMKILDMVKNP